MALRFKSDKLSREQIADLNVRLKQARTAVANREMRTAMEFILETSIDLARLYPPELAGQNYVRTRTLAEGWNSSIIGGGHIVVGILRNPVSYAPLVMTRDSQVLVHQGRWNVIEDIVDLAGGLVMPMEQAAVNISIYVG